LSPETKEDVVINNLEAVPAQRFTKRGAVNVEVQDLIGESQGSGHAVLRRFTIQKDGHTHLDEHEYEHIVYVLKGHGILRKEKDQLALRPGDTVFIRSNVRHEFANQRADPLVYLLLNLF